MMFQQQAFIAFLANQQTIIANCNVFPTRMLHFCLFSSGVLVFDLCAGVSQQVRGGHGLKDAYILQVRERGENLIISRLSILN